MNFKAIITILTLILSTFTCIFLRADDLREPYSLAAAEYVASSARMADEDITVLERVAQRYDSPLVASYVLALAEESLESAAAMKADRLNILFDIYEESSDVRFRRALRAKWNSMAGDRTPEALAFAAEYARRYGPKDQRDSIWSSVAQGFRALSAQVRPSYYLNPLLTALDYVPEKSSSYADLLSVLEETLAESDAEDDWHYIHAALKSLRMGYMDESQGARIFVLYEKALDGLGDTFCSLPDDELSAFIAASLEYEAWHNIDRPLKNKSLKPAFDGAEGGGRFTQGGRGGAVYVVTTLEDHGKEGSLRYAVEAEGAREVTFAVEGDILLRAPLKIRNSNISILGQTAPGEGITIRNYGLSIEADEVVIRYLRVRPGSASGEECDAMEIRHSDHVIIDHCSFSWASDEVLSFYACSNATLQWCIISEALNHSVHSKGEHGYGGIWGGRNISFHHNLLVSNNSRNPRFDHPSVYDGEDLLLRRGSVDFVNNLVFNWGMKAVYGGGRGWFNVRDNYFKAGPASRQLQGEYLEVYTSKSTSLLEGSFYISGNVYDCSAVEKTGNYQGKFPKVEKIRMQEEEYGRISVSKPFALSDVPEPESAIKAYRRVLESAGASLHRDQVDTRVVRETETGVPLFKGSVSGIPGIIDSENDLSYRL